VSKAFFKEDTPPSDETDGVPKRDRRFPITAAGYARLRRELESLTGETSESAERRARVLVQTLESVDVVPPVFVDGRAGFGTRVTVQDAGGREIVYDLVGPDEADLAAGRISIASPVAQAIVGKRAGEVAVIRRPKGDVEVTVRAVSLAE
jgi:transcription elongation factor GreB